jgi:hypothetical protein
MFLDAGDRQMPVTINQPHVSQINQSVQREYVSAWTSNASGVASDTINLVQGGELVGVQFVPGTSGNQPTDSYDVTALDAYSFDVLMGQGANLSNSTVTKVCPTIPAKDGTTTSTGPQPVSGTITIAVANAGNAKSGTVVFYVR